MSGEWQFQVRVNLPDTVAATARRAPDDATIAPLTEILKRHDAVLKCQYDAFAEYVAEAEKQGSTEQPLYRWTKATLEDPAKTEKFRKSFTLYVAGQEVYGQAEADALEADLRPLVGGALVDSMAKHDTNPANNPQPPKRFRD